MKKILLFVLCIMLVSCGTKDAKQEQISALVLENAMGNDLKYEPIETKEITQVTYQEILDSYLKELQLEEKEPFEETVKRTEFVIASAQKENNPATFKLFNYKLNRLKKYKEASDKKAIAYKVYEHKYSINPMQNDFKVTVTNYYFFDAQDKLIGSVSEDKYKECKDTYIMHEKSPYEFMLFESSL